MPLPRFPDVSKLDPNNPRTIIDALAKTQRELTWVLQSLDSTNITSIDPSKLTGSAQETGYCGVGAVGQGGTGPLHGVGVNFRTPKPFTPSSITLTPIASNVSANVSDIRNTGFWLYINNNGTTNFLYWRGTYTG